MRVCVIINFSIMIRIPSGSEQLEFYDILKHLVQNTDYYRTAYQYVECVAGHPTEGIRGVGCVNAGG